MPLKDREAYNEYMRRYMLTNRSKKRTQMKAVQMFLEWIAKAKAGDKATLLMYEKDMVVALVPKENVLPFFTSASKLGLSKLEFAKTFTITCEVGE